MSDLIKRLIIYTYYTFYIHNIPSKNTHVIMQNCVLCPTSLMLYNAAISMIL